MLFILFSLYEIIFQNPDNVETFTLKAGKHIFHLHGGQGGGGHDDNHYYNNGGKGAYVSGTLMITGNPQTFYARVGGKGKSSPGGPNGGGQNGGGKGGSDDLGLGNDASGGGGGASDIRYGEGKDTRIIVAAGGSGGACLSPGADGGDFNGKFRGCNGPHSYDCGCDSYPLYESKKTTQTTGNNELGVGGNGKSWTTCSGSGGGGGWQGGVATGQTSGYKDHFNVSVADSGSSYISGYKRGDKQCSRNEKYVFEDGRMEVSTLEGDGYIRIVTEFECNERCSMCSSKYVCQECFSPYKLYNGNCINSCPTGTRDLGKICKDCEVGNCKNCPIENSCNVCNDKFNLLIENNAYSCVENCPVGKLASNGKCIDCDNNCRSCTGTANSCDSCNENNYLFNNKCYAQCSALNDETKKEFYGQDNENKRCQKCIDNNCIDCSPDFNQCQKCSSLYYVDQNTHLCVLIPSTSVSSETNEPSEEIKITNTQEPLDPTQLSCLVLVNDEELNIYGRCYFEGNKVKNARVNLVRSNFTDFFYESDGGAIFFTDCSTKFRDATFSNCVSSKGAGGAVYIKNILPTDDLIFEDLVFINCKAFCGGAIFAFVKSETSNITIIRCIFIQNEAIGQKSDENKDFFGGHALFYGARNGNILNCSFIKNIGISIKGGAAIKIYNKFDDDKMNIRLMNKQNQLEKSITISDCYFESNEKSSNFIYYINGKDASTIEVKDCNLKGKSSNISSFINGKEFDLKKLKINIIQCNINVEDNINENLSYHFDLSYALVLFIAVVALIIVSLQFKKLAIFNQEIDQFEDDIKTSKI